MPTLAGHVNLLKKQLYCTASLLSFRRKQVNPQSRGFLLRIAKATLTDMTATAAAGSTFAEKEQILRASISLSA
jgi:hypothetical protein